MNKLFLPYNIALSLKEIGFDEPSFKWYFDEELNNGSNDSVMGQDQDFWFQHWRRGENFVVAPLYDQVIDWFIEKHDSFLEVQQLRHPRTKYIVIVRSRYTRGKIIKTEALPRYEALNAGIEKCIELIKQKRNEKDK